MELGIAFDDGADAKDAYGKAAGNTAGNAAGPVGGVATVAEVFWPQ